MPKRVKQELPQYALNQDALRRQHEEYQEYLRTGRIKGGGNPGNGGDDGPGEGKGDEQAAAKKRVMKRRAAARKKIETKKAQEEQDAERQKERRAEQKQYEDIHGNRGEPAQHDEVAPDITVTTRELVSLGGYHVFVTGGPLHGRRKIAGHSREATKPIHAEMVEEVRDVLALYQDEADDVQDGEEIDQYAPGEYGDETVI